MKTIHVNPLRRTYYSELFKLNIWIMPLFSQMLYYSSYKKKVAKPDKIMNEIMNFSFCIL